MGIKIQFFIRWSDDSVHEFSVLSLKTINIARTQEATSNQLQNIRGIQTTTVNALRQGPHTRQPAMQEIQSKDKRCGNCGKLHGLTRRCMCQAYRANSQACDKYNHWIAVCHSRPQIKPRGHAM